MFSFQYLKFMTHLPTVFYSAELYKDTLEYFYILKG